MKIYISYLKCLYLLISFATSPGLRDFDHRSSHYELFREGWSPTERRLLFSEKDLLDSQLNIIKTEILWLLCVRLVVSFATSPGLRDSDHRSSRYDRFCAGWSKMHGCSSFFRKASLTFRSPFAIFLDLESLRIAL